MQKAKMQTEDGVQENIAKIKRLFPHCVTEAKDAAGRLTYEIDKELLLQELSGGLIEEGEERYCLSWPGKKQALLTANKAIDKTLRPIDAFSEPNRTEPNRTEPNRTEPNRTEPNRTEPQTSSVAFGRENGEAGRAPADLFGEQQEAGSAFRRDRDEREAAAEERSFEQASGGINFETTENVFIEGDNLDALKLLQETYLNKIKMIYIDPPYNTGRDFIYKDRRIADEDEYLADSEQIDEDGNYLVANPVSNGRFHSDWLSFIYPRLKLARNLLSDDGVIFISIDDNEQANLKKLCDEIFGAENYRNSFILKRPYKSLNAQFADGGIASFNNGFETVLCFSKTADFKFKPVFREASAERKQSGLWAGFYNNMDRPTMRYELLGFTPPDGQWKWAKEKGLAAAENYAEYEANYAGQMSLEEYWEKTGKSKRFIRRKHSGQGKNMGVEYWVPPSDKILRNTDWMDINASRVSDEVRGLFSFPKNPDAIKLMLNSVDLGENDIILDFFAGSGTTARAVIELNAEDGGNRRFILVQLPEVIKEENTEFANIAEICKERIRRAGQMIKTGKYSDGRPVKDWQPPKNPDLDIGFRVFKIDSSNMREDYYRLPQETDQAALTEKADNIKPGRSAEDLLFQLFLEWGVPLSARIEKEEIDGKQVFFVNKSEFEGIQTDMIACFDCNLAESLLIKLAQLKPLRAVFRDHGFATDSMRENLEGIFKQIAPDTDLRVI